MTTVIEHPRSRNIIPLSDYDRENDNDERIKFAAHIRQLDRNGTSVIYPNQQIAAMKIYEKFCDASKVFVILIALTQSGKTGTILAFIKQCISSPNIHTPINNIYVITALSSTEWKIQTKIRLPFNIKVFHRDDLKDEFVEELKNKRDVIIIMDEVNVASQMGQTIQKQFKKIGWDSLETLLDKDIKILELSATPDGCLFSLADSNWGNHVSMLTSDPGEGYTSIFNLLDMGRVKQYHDLSGYNRLTGEVRPETIEHIRCLKREIDSYLTPRYHIIRTSKGSLVRDNLYTVFPCHEYNFKFYDQESGKLDINTILSVAPRKHTFVLIKEKLRCAFTLIKEHLGILYERCPQRANDSVIIQGLAGRITGYDTNNDSVVYTNIDTILRYRAIWNNNFDSSTLAIRWKSLTTHFSRYLNMTVGTRTFNSASLYMDVSQETTSENKIRYMVFHGEDGQAQMQNNFKDNFNHITFKQKPHKRIKETQGEYEGKYVASIKRKRKAWTEAEILNKKTWLGAANNGYWMYCCYTDLNDNNTLKWYLISRNLKPEISQEFVN